MISLPVFRGWSRLVSGALARALVALLLAQLAPGPAAAQQTRPVALPANATYGEMKAFRYPEAQIDKRMLRLAPGARVYNTQNLILMPGSVPSQAPVLYRLDIQGQIAQMWLLTADEAKMRAPKSQPKGGSKGEPKK
jgi:hypothetical protein